ncbi:type II secretion system F family protein [Cytobacillus sp. FJAT-54145]|uniref:Type II secretion system F family protein n=1 Tax=Cytobacillus spartinae TaxID=3299023 RepID=A0ABW6KJF7_9BACI
MAPFIIATLAAFMFIISIYFYLDHRMVKKEWRKNIHEFYHEGKKRKSIIVLLGDRFDRTEMAIPIYERLRSANISLTPSEYIGALIVSYMGVIILLQNFFSIKFPINLIFAMIALEGGKRILFLIRKNYMKQKLVEQLPEICRTLANSTRSGMTLTQGINLVAQEVAEPARSEFQRLAQEIALGIDFNSALKALEKRIDSREFQLFVATLLIQKKAGGNLYSVLDEMSNTLEERKILLQEVKTMTAEQRYVSYIVPVIPIFLVLMMNNVIDGFLDPLFSGVGLFLLAFFLVGTVLTFILVRKVTNIRV